jgi:DNA-binding FadR family transcriptional regulator
LQLGHYAHSPAENNCFLNFQSQNISLSHLVEFREDVEGIVAAHAAERHTADDIKALRHLLAQAHKCVDQESSQRNAFINLDKQIHMNMAVITGNPIYISVLHSIHDNIHRYYDRFLSIFLWPFSFNLLSQSHLNVPNHKNEI